MKNHIFFLAVLSLLFILSVGTVQAVFKAPITRVAWVPESERFIIVNAQQKLVSWDTVAECPLYFYNAHKSDVLKVIVSDNARLAVSSSLDKRIKIWDIETGAEKHEITGFDAPANAIALSDNAKKMIVGDWQGVVKEWDLSNFQEESRFKAFDTAVASLALYYPKRFIAAGSSGGEIVLWDMQLDRLVKRISTPHSEAVTAIEFSSDGQFIVSASDKGHLSVWQFSQENIRYITLAKAPVIVRSMDLSPDGQYALVGSDSGMMYLVDLHAGVVVYQFKLSSSPLQLVKFRSNFEAVLVDQDYRVWSFSLATYKLRPVTEVSRDAILPISMKPFREHNWMAQPVGMDFIWVPGGCFELGCDVVGGKGCAADNMPAKNICLDSYWMAKHEVNVTQWMQVVGKYLPRSNIAIPLINQDVAGEGNVLASGVSWKESQGFVCRLNSLTGADFRLPTEAEWEYACKNTNETQSLQYRQLSDNSVMEQSAISGLNIEGMHSGVSEWVLDIYNRFGYTKNRHLNPLFLDDSLYYFYTQAIQRVKRGGAWDTGRSVPECIVREFNFENSGHDFKTGLRLTIH